MNEAEDSELKEITRRLDEQYKLIVDHVAEDRVRYNQQMELSKSNLEAIAKLTASTQDVVNASVSDSEILLQGKKWKILEINKDLRAHDKGMHVKVRLGSRS